MINEEKKQEICDLLGKYCERYGSRNSAALSLKNVSSSTVSSIMNGRWENISEAMWKSIQTQASDSSTGGEWQIVESTQTFKDVFFVLKEAQREKSMIWLTAKAGSGKTVTAEAYRSRNKDVIYVLCDEDMRKSSFANELARAAGMRINTQKLAREKLLIVLDFIAEMDNPIIIFDEADKLSDALLYYFITIYNYLKKKVGIVLLSTNYIQKRMETGLKYDKKGFDEIDSRIGRKFYAGEVPDAHDVYAIGRANGITDDKLLSEIVKDASECNFDLRRVERKVCAMRNKMQIAAL